MFGALLALSIGCGQPADTPAASTTGRPARPERIVSLIPATTEILFAIGAGDRVVGVGSFDRFPAEIEALPRVGGLIDPDTERIFSLEPDLVVAYATQTDLLEQLKRAGVPTYVYEHRALPDVTETVRLLGARVGSTQESEMLAAQMERDLDDVRRSVEGRDRPSVLLVFGREPGSLRNIYASGGYGFLADLLRIAGGDNVFADVDRQSVQASTEQLLALGPEVILELQYDASAAGLSGRRVDDWSGLSSIPAVRQGRVHILRGDEFVVPGPRVVVAAQRMAAALAPNRQPAR